MQKPKIDAKSRWALSTTVLVLLVIVVVVIIAAAGAASYVIVKSSHSTTPTTATTSALEGYPGYPSTLPSTPTPVSFDGSSLLYIPMLAWFANFTAHYPNVQMNIGASGSGVGQSEVEANLVNVGDSDAYLSNITQAAYPWLLNIPLAVSAQQINYNVPGIPASVHLNFSGPVLAGIYNGSIAKWNDPQIAALQSPSVAALLPADSIIPIHRADSSGDTFIFTQYLSFTTPWWNNTVGYGLTVSWPVDSYATDASGNSGMVQTVQQDPYSIAYVGISFLSVALTSGEGYGYLENQAGRFVNISAANIQADVDAFVSKVPTDERISLVNGPGENAYPIVNFEYAIVAKNQTNADVAKVIQTYLSWIMDPQWGSSPQFLDTVGFVALPSSVYQLSEAQLNSIYVT